MKMNFLTLLTVGAFAFNAPASAVSVDEINALNQEPGRGSGGRPFEFSEDILMLNPTTTWYCCVTLYRECTYDQIADANGNITRPRLKELSFGTNADGTDKMVAETGRGAKASDQTTTKTKAKLGGHQDGKRVVRYSKTTCEIAPMKPNGVPDCQGKPTKPVEPGACQDIQPNDGQEFNN